MGNSTKTSVSIRERVKAKLKLGDDGKLMSFFDRELKGVERNIKSLNHNKTVTTSKYEVDSESIQDKIVDAKENVLNAYDAVTPEDVATNAAQDAFAPFYWGKIKEAKRKLKSLEESLESVTKVYQEAIKDLDAQIADWTERRDLIQA